MPKKSQDKTDSHQAETLDFHRSIPEIDECRFLIKKVIEQAVRDFAALEHAESSSDQQDFQTAYAFLFDDGYRISWGGEEMSLQDLLDWVDLDQEWVRKKALLARKRKQKKIQLRKEAKRKEQDEDDKDSIPSGVDGV